MPKIIWGLLLCPLLGWAQTEGLPPTPPSADPGPSSVSALNYAGASGLYNDALSHLRDKLNLTPAQQPLWRAYEGKVDAYTGQHAREKPVLASAHETAPQQIVRLVQNLQNRLTALEDIELAVKTLYAVLTPEQQKILNPLLLSTIPTFSQPGNAGGPTGDSPRSDRRPSGGRPPSGGMGGGMGGAMGGGMGGGWGSSSGF